MAKYGDAPQKNWLTPVMKANKVVTMPKPTVKSQPMQKGEIRKLAKVNSPLWKDQWAVQGTGKIPYIVSHKNNAQGSEDEWQCSCPSWTGNMPREDCKHILKIKLVEKVPIVPTTVILLPKKNAGAGIAQHVVNEENTLTLKTFEKKGRKFR